MSYIILIIFHFSFLLVNCGNVSVVVPPVEMPKTSIELMTEPIGETMVKLDTKQFSRQAKFASTLRTAFDGLRLFVKFFVNSYNWYQPELVLGKCVFKYTRTLYPEFMQMRLSYDNVIEYLRSLYFAIYGYITEMINENRQDIQAERQRIGMKVAEMTLRDGTSSFLPSAATTTILSAPATFSSSISSSRPINHIKPSLHNYNDGNFNYMEKFGSYFPNHHDANSHQSNRKFGLTQNYGNELKVMAQSFNDFSPSTRSMDTLKFDKNIFLSNSINATEYDANESISLETELPFDTVNFQTKHSVNYNVPAADSSLSSSQTTASANTFDLLETGKNEKFSQALAVPENNLNIEKSHKRNGKPNKVSVMYVGPRQFSADYQDDMSPLSDDIPTLDLNKNSNADEKGAGYDDSSTFDFENIILESFGFNAKAVQSSTLARCMRSYVIELVRRTFEYFILL